MLPETPIFCLRQTNLDKLAMWEDKWQIASHSDKCQVPVSQVIYKFKEACLARHLPSSRAASLVKTFWVILPQRAVLSLNRPLLVDVSGVDFPAMHCGFPPMHSGYHLASGSPLPVLTDPWYVNQVAAEYIFYIRVLWTTFYSVLTQT